jgi:hypothetical protein
LGAFHTPGFEAAPTRPRRVRRAARWLTWPFRALLTAVRRIVVLIIWLVVTAVVSLVAIAGVIIRTPWWIAKATVRGTRRFTHRLRLGEATAVAALALALVATSAAGVVAANLRDGAHERGFDDSELARRFGDAVFRVVTKGCGLDGGGTAFAIDEHHLVTNWHVVLNDTEPGLESRDGDTLHGDVIGWSMARDVAVIEVEEDLPLALEWADPARLSEGDHLLTLGYPVPGSDFSAIPGSILSFDSVGDVRRTIRTDGQVDHGDSGGPALTRHGEVAGVVTEFDPNLEGVQLVALANTSARLGDWVQDTLEDPYPPTVNCNQLAFLYTPEPFFPEDYFVPEVYGDDPFLDELYDACEAGDMTACDDLWFESPEGSDYEQFSTTCGDRSPDPMDGTCEADFRVEPVGPSTYGDDRVLDKLYEGCAAGDEDACDLLWLRAGDGTAYQVFADICGGRRSPGSGGMCGKPEGS